MVLSVEWPESGCEIKAEIQLPGVQFETNSDELAAGSEQVLNNAARTLANNPNLVVEVAGYTDSRGDAEHNLVLSAKRANRVRDFLVDQGISFNRLSAMGYGEDNPVSDNDTADGRAANRRVTLRIMRR